MKTIDKLAIRYAVVVGINDYNSSPMSSLNYCSNDAEAFFDALIHYAQYKEENIVLFSDGNHAAARKPTYSDILSAIHEICGKATSEDSILFFFAGHGTRNEFDSYLLTKEYRPNVLTESSISITKVNDYFSNSAAKFKLRFFDACHSGRMGIRGVPNPDVEKHLAVTAEGWATLASCKEDQYAHELGEIKQGIFSYFIIKGLSGEASVDGSQVTLDNLKVYVMDKTIDLSKKRGLEQTPVFSGAQAGSLILTSMIHTDASKVLPESLSKIENVVPSTLEPAADDTVILLEEVKNKLMARSEVGAFIAPSQEQKINLLTELTDRAFKWTEIHVERDNGKLPGHDLFSTQLTPVSQSPLNKRLAKYLYDSKVKNALEWKYQFHTETKTRRVYTAYVGISRGPYETESYTEQVVDGIEEPNGYPNSSILLMFTPSERTFPYCGMSTLIIPCTFGLYVLCYFASTVLIEEMKEAWSSSSFSIRGFEAVPVREITQFNFEEWLENLYPQFMSFIVESIEARQRTLIQLGAAPNVNLTQR